MKKKNDIKAGTRVIELLIDYVMIVIYLFLVFIIILLIYWLILGGIPELTSFQSQLLATLTTVIPVTLTFSVLDYKEPYGTIGKRMVGLKVSYTKYSYLSSLIRNSVKFLPWQLGHMGVIDGVYSEFTTTYSVSLTLLSSVLAIILIVMGILGRDKRHLGDILAGTQVIPRS